MMKEEFFKHTQSVCDLLNALIPCKTQEDIDRMSSLLSDYFALPVQPVPKIYWSREIWIDCGFDDEKCINLLLFTDKLYFEPTDDMDEHPGVCVKYKWMKLHNA